MADPVYKWRPAMVADIGSVARFGDTLHEKECWCYGILENIRTNNGDRLYVCNDGNERVEYFYSQIQYDANQEP